jgi:hypothetical protein
MLLDVPELLKFLSAPYSFWVVADGTLLLAMSPWSSCWREKEVDAF